MNSLSRIFFVLQVLILSILSTTPCLAQVRILHHSSQKLVFSCRFDHPLLETIFEDGERRMRLSVPQEGWIESGPFSLPLQVLPLHIPATDIDLEINKLESTRIELDAPLQHHREQSLSTGRVEGLETGDHDDEPASLYRLGRMNGFDVWRLCFNPVRYDSSAGQLIVDGSYTVTLSWSSSSAKARRVMPNTFALQSAEQIELVLGEPYLLATERDVRNQQSQSNAMQRCKLYIEQDGWYRVTGKDLRQAGVDLLSIDMRTVQLTCGSSQVPIYVQGWQDGQFNEQDGIEFWGEYARYPDRQTSPDLYEDPYGPIRVYYLSWGTSLGLWLTDESGAVTSESNPSIHRPYSFMQTVHVEQSPAFNHLRDVPEGDSRDHFFYDSGIAAAEKRDYLFDLWHPDKRSAQPLQIRIMMGGKSTPSSSMDPFFHKISAYINNRYVLEGEWYGQNYSDLRTEATNTLVGADLYSGRNSLTLINLVDASKIDYVMLNWFEVTYPRLYRAHEGWLRFTMPPDYTPGLYRFQIDGFSSHEIDIFKLGSSRIVGAVTKETTDFEDFTSIQVTFQDQATSSATEYLAIERDRKKKPHKILPVNPVRLRAENLACDYLVITHNRFFNSPGLDRLIGKRQDQGLQVLKVDVADIYDEFGDGRPTPEALKAFLSHAYHTWKNPRLKYVLLVGNGSRQRRTALGDTLDLVPVYLRQTWQWGATASDYWYTLLDGDDELSEIALGRLPARTVDECDALTNKIVAYENESVGGSWRNRHLFIGGNFSNQAPFHEQALDLVQRMSPDYEKNILLTVRRGGVENDPFFGGTADLLDYIDEGCSIINFHGHGGGGIWADNGLLRTEDVGRFANRGKWPFIMSMTCFSGAFESPSFRGLADALLFNEEIGSVAFLGASGEGWVVNDYLLQREILQVYDRNPSLPLGELIRQGKNLYQIQNGPTPYVFSETNQYHLLGDPALRLGGADQRIPLSAERSLLNPGETVSVDVELPFARGSGQAVLIDSALTASGRQSLLIQDGSASFQIDVPNSFGGSTGRLVFYGEDELGLQRVHGSCALSLAPVLFDSLRVQPLPGDSSRLLARIVADQSIDRVWGRVQSDSIPFFPLSGERYHSAPFYYPFGFNYRVFVRLDDDRVLQSEGQDFTPADRIDLAVLEQSIHLRGSKETRLAVRLSNNSAVDVAGVDVQFEHYDEKSGVWLNLGRDRVDLSALSKVQAEVPFSPIPGTARVRVTVDPDTLFDRLFRYDNRFSAVFAVEHFNCIPELGLVAGDSLIHSLQLDSVFALRLSSGAVAAPTVLTVFSTPFPGIDEQPDFQALSGILAYRFFTADSSEQFVEPVAVAFHLSALLRTRLEEIGKPVHIFRLQERSGKWVRLEQERHEDQLLAFVRQGGVYTLLAGEDRVPPTIELMVDGQPPVENGFVQRRPRIAAVLQDVNGVDLSKHDLFFHIDGQPVTQESIRMPDRPSNGNQVVVEIRPEFVPGRHTIELTAFDCFGNMSLPKEFSFQVAERFDVRLLGTYPNPFMREMIFAYELTQPCDRLEIKIYTASGQLIRTLDARESLADSNPLGADYHELLWDGRDQSGDSVANGVYFYKLSVAAGGQSLELTGKLMRLQ
ncbi:hypothetical protein JW992_06050 [candidate division KSB1 bacterium]|nr:hypothetical protein [candidate division KSB1 bacterium]